MKESSFVRLSGKQETIGKMFIPSVGRCAVLPLIADGMTRHKAKNFLIGTTSDLCILR